MRVHLGGRMSFMAGRAVFELVIDSQMPLYTAIVSGPVVIIADHGSPEETMKTARKVFRRYHALQKKPGPHI